MGLLLVFFFKLPIFIPNMGIFSKIYINGRKIMDKITVLQMSQDQRKIRNIPQNTYWLSKKIILLSFNAIWCLFKTLCTLNLKMSDIHILYKCGQKVDFLFQTVLFANEPRPKKNLLFLSKYILIKQKNYLVIIF